MRNAKTLKASNSVSSRASRTILKAASKKFSAFTLVELIVVITILAILATIGFLALSGYSQDAKDAAVKANVRSVMTAISAESAITNNSPRYYVVHDPSAALADGTVAYVDGDPVTLTGGSHGTAGTNYSAGNPDWAKLRLNPEKFRLSSLGARFASAFGNAGAAYDPKSLSVGALDATLAPTTSGRNRSTSFFQVTGTAPATKTVSVAGNFPAPSTAQASWGGTVGLVKGSGTSALVDGGTQEGTSGPTAYPGCDTPDITLANGQIWAACNAGATTAYSGQAYPSNMAPTAAQKAYMGAYYQWGRNDDVTATSTTATLAPSNTLASTVGHSLFITNTYLGTPPNVWKQ